MLRIVHPAPRGQGSGPPKRRKGQRSDAYSLTNDEARNVRRALKNLVFGLGGADVAALVLGVPIDSVYGRRKQRPSGTFAIRIAKAAGLPVETILTGKMRLADRCPTCGAHAADRGKGRHEP